MHRNDYSRFVRAENGRRVTFVQPRVVRRYVSDSKPISIQRNPQNRLIEANSDSLLDYYERDNTRHGVRTVYPTRSENAEYVNTVSSSNNYKRNIYPRGRRVMRVVEDDYDDRNDKEVYPRYRRVMRIVENDDNYQNDREMQPSRRRAIRVVENNASYHNNSEIQPSRRRAIRVVENNASYHNDRNIQPSRRRVIRVVENNKKYQNDREKQPNRRRVMRVMENNESYQNDREIQPSGRRVIRVVKNNESYQNDRKTDPSLRRVMRVVENNEGYQNDREVYLRRREMRGEEDSGNYRYHNQDMVVYANNSRLNNRDGTRRYYLREASQDSDDMTESDFSSDEESIKPSRKVKIVRIVPNQEITSQQQNRHNDESYKQRSATFRKMTSKDELLSNSMQDNTNRQKSAAAKLYAGHKNEPRVMSSTMPIHTSGKSKITMIGQKRINTQTSQISNVKQWSNSYSTGSDETSYDRERSEESAGSSKESLDSDESSGESSSEDSYSDSSTESSSTDPNRASMINKNISMQSSQTSRVLLDYSKMLQSREERKMYEKERKQFEHETNVVTLVQKEINKKKKDALVTDNEKNNSKTKNSDIPDSDEKFCECKSTSKHSSIDNGKSCACQLLKIDPKPLPTKKIVKHDLDETIDIKENIRTEEIRRRKREERSKLLAWTGRENFSNDKCIKRDIKSADMNRQYKPKAPEESDGPDNVEVCTNQNDDFESLYPVPRSKGSQQVYYIDLTKPTEILEPKPFDVESRRIVPQPKETYDGPLVKVGGGWNTMDDYMSRHVPVKTFVHQREHKHLPDIKKKFYGFNSHYKLPHSNLVHRPL